MKYELARKILFLLPAELAHNWGLRALRILGWLYRTGLWKKPRHTQETISPFGPLSCKVGLAAGLDKNAQALWAWEALGFGFVEVGTATPVGQPGNPKPRLFRIPDQKAILNRMGFNNDGAFAIAARIHRAKQQGLKIKVGGNIGKNKDTPLEKAPQDYLKAALIMAPICDYLTINVSSPNTPGLRSLQSKEHLEKIVSAVMSVSKSIPVFIKVAPDDGLAQSQDIVEIVDKFKMAGVIVANTLKQEDGGLSGQPVFQTNLNLATHYVQTLREKKSTSVVIGVGGISSVKEAAKYLEAGCSLIQIYSGFIYQGPLLVRQLAKL